MSFGSNYILNPYIPVALVNDYAQQSFTGSSTVTKTLASPMTGIVISNDGADGTPSMTLQVNGFDWEIKAGETFEERFYPFTEFTIVTTVPFRAYVKGPVVSLPAQPEPPTPTIYNQSGIDPVFLSTIEGKPWFIYDTGSAKVLIVADTADSYFYIAGGFYKSTSNWKKYSLSAATFAPTLTSTGVSGADIISVVMDMHRNGQEIYNDINKVITAFVPNIDPVYIPTPAYQTPAELEAHGVPYIGFTRASEPNYKYYVVYAQGYPSDYRVWVNAGSMVANEPVFYEYFIYINGVYDSTLKYTDDLRWDVTTITKASFTVYTGETGAGTFYTPS